MGRLTQREKQEKIDLRRAGYSEREIFEKSLALGKITIPSGYGSGYGYGDNEYKKIFLNG